MKVAFVDRDGTMIWEPPETKQIDSLEKLRILPGVIDGLITLQEQGFILVMVSNQDGLGTDSFPQREFDIPQTQLLDTLARRGILFANIFVCPHREVENCACRKPNLGLVRDFLVDNEIDRDLSVVIGDRNSDEQFAEQLGVRFVRMETNSSFPRFGFAEHEPKRGDISACVNLDGTPSS